MSRSHFDDVVSLPPPRHGEKEGGMVLLRCIKGSLNHYIIRHIRIAVFIYEST
jgi:hypothetical protein